MRVHGEHSRVLMSSSFEKAGKAFSSPVARRGLLATKRLQTKVCLLHCLRICASHSDWVARGGVFAGAVNKDVGEGSRPREPRRCPIGGVAREGACVGQTMKGELEKTE